MAKLVGGVVQFRPRSLGNLFLFKTTCLIFRDKVFMLSLSLFFEIEKPENLKSICLKISESPNPFSRKVQIDLPQNLLFLNLKSWGSFRIDSPQNLVLPKLKT